MSHATTASTTAGEHTVGGLLQWTTLGTAVGCGVSAGALFAFSSFVMPALKRLPDAHGIEAMQSINKLAITPAFMTAMFGTAIACVALGVHAGTHWGDRRAALTLAGCALYLVGPIGVTMFHHDPMNRALDQVHAHASGAARYWHHYVASWSAWNHVRAATGIAASGLLAVALRVA